MKIKGFYCEPGEPAITFLYPDESIRLEYRSRNVTDTAPIFNLLPWAEKFLISSNVIVYYIGKLGYSALRLAVYILSSVVCTGGLENIDKLARPQIIRSRCKKIDILLMHV